MQSTGHASFDLEEFRKYLRVSHHKNEDTTLATLRDVNMYLSEYNEQDGTDDEKLLSIRRIESFVQIMEDDKQYKATTRAEKLRRIKLAIKCLIRENDNPELYYRGRRAIDFIDELCHGLGKSIGVQRQEHALHMRQKLNTMMDPNEFLDNEMV